MANEEGKLTRDIQSQEELFVNIPAERSPLSETPSFYSMP
jgi:hypothetical protein